MSFTVYPKTGIYFSHYECFGHTSRVIAFSEIFKKEFPRGDLFFIQAGLKQPQARLHQWGRVYSLPGVLADRRWFRAGGLADVHDAGRGHMCLDVLRLQKPDLFITEFFPLGHEECRHELIPCLVRAFKQNTLLWAVAGYPLLTGLDHWRDKILPLYQRVMIFSPPIEKEFMADALPKVQRQKYLDFFKKHEKKIIFAGYLLPEEKVVRDVPMLFPNVSVGNPEKADTLDSRLKHSGMTAVGVCRVAVVRGGGAYYPKLIAQAIRASDLLGEGYHVIVVSGPSTTHKEWNFFNSLLIKKRINNATLIASTEDYEGLIKDSDVCVSVASYHTSVMLMKHGKKSVVIPFEGYEGKTCCYEQPARAQLLKEMIQAKVLSIKNLTAVSLAKAIRESHARNASSRGVLKEFFSGPKVLAQSLRELFRPQSD